MGSDPRTLSPDFLSASQPEPGVPPGPSPARGEGRETTDPLDVAFDVRRSGELLRTGECAPSDIAEVVAKLVSLARDANARVRQAVAEVAPYVPERASREILAALADDKSPYVRDAAERAERRRATLRRSAAETEEHDARVDRWYREIDKSGARAVARRIASHETEYFVRRMVHEASSSFPAFSQSVTKLRALLEAGEIDRGEARACLDRIEERFAHFNHVLETGRAQARPAGEPTFERRAVGEILADEAKLLVARFPDRTERIRVDLADVERGLEIDLDEGFLRQAIANILKNAIEAYDGRDARELRVTVSARAVAEEACAEIAIRDYGCGMHEPSAERAFVPFGSSKVGGTGFGLFIARRVARNVHGGELTLESVLGEGTRVTMTLPLRQEVAKKRRGRVVK